jgi:D-3-phosphoglycerate dehydrogenase
MRIAIPDDYQNAVSKLDCFRLLDGHDVRIPAHTEKDVEKLAAMLKDVEILVLIRERTIISEELLLRLRT